MTPKQRWKQAYGIFRKNIEDLGLSVTDESKISVNGVQVTFTYYNFKHEIQRTDISHDQGSFARRLGFMMLNPHAPFMGCNRFRAAKEYFEDSKVQGFKLP